MDNQIYINDWLKLKPYKNQVITDSFYLKLSNEVRRAISINTQSFKFNLFLNQDAIKILACFLTSYLEDLVSDTNIWNTFIRLHKEIYNKPLPFYNVDEYYEEEINEQDIKFLIWYFLNTWQTDEFVTPDNELIELSAQPVMDIFDRTWEVAPVNHNLLPFYQINKNETDFYKVREIIGNVLYKTYLFHTDTFFRLMESEKEIFEKHNQNDNLSMFINSNHDENVHQNHTRLLSLTGKEWLAEILGSKHPLYHSLKEMSPKIFGYFYYKGHDDTDIFLEHVASGKKFKMVIKSFDHLNLIDKPENIFLMGIVKWRNEWWFSGILVHVGFNDNLVKDEKKSVRNRQAVAFLDYHLEENKNLLLKQSKAFADLNQDASIAFITSDKLNDFLRIYTEYYNHTLKLPEKEVMRIKEKMGKEGFYEIFKPANFPKNTQSAVLFFNIKSGIEIILEVASAFPVPQNPFFNDYESEGHIMKLFMDDSISTELAMYCIDNFKTKLPFFRTDRGKLIMANADFLLRFWKERKYHTKPTITIVGQDNDRYY